MEFHYLWIVPAFGVLGTLAVFLIEGYFQKKWERKQKWEDKLESKF